MGSKDRWPGMSGRVEFGFHCLCNFSQAVPWKKLATKSSQGEARPSAKLIKLNPNKTPCFVLGFEQTKIGIKNPYLSNKKNPPGVTHWRFFFDTKKINPKTSSSRCRRSRCLMCDLTLEARTIFDSAIHFGSLGGFALLQFVATV